MTFRRATGALVGAAIASSLLASFAAPAGAAPASAGKYDGRWSVEVITDEGTCDRAYRWSIGIKDGQVAEMGDAVATASGSIEKSGKVALKFVRGADVLTAKGSLDGENGGGQWTAPSRSCSGRWRAEKRG